MARWAKLHNPICFMLLLVLAHVNFDYEHKPTFWFT